VVMHQGVADQIGTPFEIYNRPATRFVAQFVGTLSILNAIVSDAARGEVTLDGVTIQGLPLSPSLSKGAKVSLAIRPEAVSLGAGNHGITLSGQIADVDFLGSVIRIKLGVGDQTISLDTFNDPSTPPPRIGETARVNFDRESLMVLAD
jgi:putative spermidine/putrescine transport system ATP-binding protein